VPFALLLYVLFELLRSAQEAAVWATGAIIVLGIIFSYKGARLRPWQIVEAFIETGRISVELLLILGAAGFVIGVLNISGLGFALTFFLIHLGGSNEILLMIIAAIACIILGMGMPTSGVYVLLAALIAPALVQVGVQKIAAHMFILYFGMMSMITPPIALAAFAAAALAQTDAMTIGFTAMRLGWVAYIIPFLFVFAPSLLLIGSASSIVLNIGTAVIGVYVISVASIGYFTRPITPPWRVVLMVVGVAALLPTVKTPGGAFVEITGAALSILFLAYEWWVTHRPQVAGISAE